MQMFTPTYDSNPFPGFPSSSSSYPLLPFLNPESTSANTNFLLHDPIAVPIIPTNHAPIPETVTNLAVADCAAMPKQNANYAHFGISNFLTQKPSKKDRHSKIYTSQGLRDRRVRLSIEIARKFFDLQDMLGFDKASNTLEWLFTKSKKAIKELARSKNRSSAGAKSFSSSSECEVVSGINQVTDIPNFQRVDSNDQSLVGGELAAKERRLKRAQKEAACDRAKKESRTKARARARERTSYKMCIPTSATTGRVHDLKKRFPATTNSQIQHQLRSPTQPEPGSRSPYPVQPHPHLVGKETPRDDFDVIEESIVIKRKLKPSLMSSYPQNLVIPKEASFSNSEYSSFPNLSPNWDTSSAIGRSNFCAIASMNLSTELQIFGKSWEECNNQRPH